MDTLREALNRLTDAGYDGRFYADGDRLRARDAGRCYRPESLIVDEVVRFEGASDTGDEPAIFALSSATDGVRGTYTAVFGPGIGLDDARVDRRLRAGDRGQPRRGRTQPHSNEVENR